MGFRAWLARTPAGVPALPRSPLAALPRAPPRWRPRAPPPTASPTPAQLERCLGLWAGSTRGPTLGLVAFLSHRPGAQIPGL